MVGSRLARHATGQGQRVDVSQFEVGVNFAGPALLDLFANGTAARPVGNTLPYDDVAPHNVYRCAPADVEQTVDEKWVAIACMDDAQWRALRDLLGNPEWARIASYDSAAGRVAAVETIDARIGAWTIEQDPYAVMGACQAAGVPAGVVQTGIDLAENDPQLAATSFLQAVADEHPILGQTWVDRLPIHFEKTPCDDYQRVRTLGEDNAAVLQDWLGMDASAVQRAAEDGLLK